jgi:hypothetical protein
LEGLEVSVVPLSVINSEFRVEAEFFWKRYLHEATALSKLPQQTLGEFAFVTDGPHGYHVVDESSPVIMLTAKNAKDWFSDRDAADPLALFVHEANQRSSLAENDVILSTRGTVGLCALVTSEVLPANIDQDVARISFKPGVPFIPGFVIAYLNSSFGQDYMKRFASGMVQQGLSLQKVRDIPVPVLSRHFQNQVAHTVATALAKRREATSSQDQAEQTLLRALGLEGWEPPEPLTYTRRASEALAAARFDAEYFAPRVAQLLAKLSADGLTIHDVAPARHDAFDASKHKADRFCYIEISGLRSDGTATSEPTPTDEAPSRASQKVHKGDIITSTVRPIRRLSAIISPEQHEHVCSSGFVVLEPKAIASEVLLTYLRLPIICELMDLHTSASLYPAISERDILKLPIPKIPEQAAKEIITQIRQAHHARYEAQILLAQAKYAVEVAIEVGEEKAMRVLA